MNSIGKIVHAFCVRLRIWKYRLLSDCKNVKGKPQQNYPVLLKGNGTIEFSENVVVGVVLSPGYYVGYGYMEARTPISKIEIGYDVFLNNGFSIVSNEGISIGNKTIIGTNFSVVDSDFHYLNPDKRHDPNPPSAPVKIGDKVFIGNNVTVLKGVTIGDNSVIGSNSLVSSSIPDNVIAAGNPAKIIRKL